MFKVLWASNRAKIIKSDQKISWILWYFWQKQQRLCDKNELCVFVVIAWQTHWLSANTTDYIPNKLDNISDNEKNGYSWLRVGHSKSFRQLIFIYYTHQNNTPILFECHAAMERCRFFTWLPKLKKTVSDRKQPDALNASLLPKKNHRQIKTIRISHPEFNNVEPSNWEIQSQHRFRLIDREKRKLFKSITPSSKSQKRDQNGRRRQPSDWYP